MSNFKKKINYSTYDTTSSLLLDAAKSRGSSVSTDTKGNKYCCSNKNEKSGIDYKQYINTLEKNTLIKDKQINNVNCCEGKLKCCINKNCCK